MVKLAQQRRRPNRQLPVLHNDRMRVLCATRHVAIRSVSITTRLPALRNRFAQTGAFIQLISRRLKCLNRL
jgi:hypothetical protein